MQKKHQTIDADTITVAMSVAPVRLVFFKVETIKGETITIPLDPEQAVQLGITMAGAGHAQRRVAATGDEQAFDRDLDQLADLLN